MQDELGDTSSSDLGLMLGELELTNLLEGNRRSDVNPTDVDFAPSPALHARGHSSPNHNDMNSGRQRTDDLTELTLRFVYISL